MPSASSQQQTTRHRHFQDKKQGLGHSLHHHNIIIRQHVVTSSYRKLNSNHYTMKFSPSILAAVSAVALCATVATAFTVGPRNNGALSSLQQRQQSIFHSNRTGSTSLRMDTDAFMESEISGNGVSCL
jgi:hypothetical protein